MLLASGLLFQQLRKSEGWQKQLGLISLSNRIGEPKVNVSFNLFIGIIKLNITSTTLLSISNSTRGILPYNGFAKFNCDTPHLQSGEQRATNNISYNKSPYTQLHSPKAQIKIRIKNPVAPIRPNIIYSSVLPEMGKRRVSNG
ncbi:hypothetical protein YC2023_013656 [Brassica napus]